MAHSHALLPAAVAKQVPETTATGQRQPGFVHPLGAPTTAGLAAAVRAPVTLGKRETKRAAKKPGPIKLRLLGAGSDEGGFLDASAPPQPPDYDKDVDDCDITRDVDEVDDSKHAPTVIQKIPEDQHSKICHIEAGGDSNSFTLMESGELYAFGPNESVRGLPENRDDEDHSYRWNLVPLPPGLTSMRVVQVSANGDAMSVLLDSGEVCFAGSFTIDNKHYRPAVGARHMVGKDETLRKIPLPGPANAIAAGADFCAVTLQAGGAIFTYGTVHFFFPPC